MRKYREPFYFWSWLAENHPVANGVVQNGILIIAFVALIISAISLAAQVI